MYLYFLPSSQKDRYKFFIYLYILLSKLFKFLKFPRILGVYFYCRVLSSFIPKISVFCVSNFFEKHSNYTFYTILVILVLNKSFKKIYNICALSVLKLRWSRFYLCSREPQLIVLFHFVEKIQQKLYFVIVFVLFQF